MKTRKIPISELRSIIDTLNTLYPKMAINSRIDFDLLKLQHDLALRVHSVKLGGPDES